MLFTRKLYKHEDNAVGRFNAGISASSLTIPLQSGQGALLPVTAGATATSTGTSTALNSTGIQAALTAAGVGVGDIIENVTDGSYAVIKSITTNAIVTTRLQGGTTNVWNNTNKWAINRFIVTAIKYDVDGTTVLRREKILIESRSGDNLTVNTTGRGYDGSTAYTFDTGDYVYLFLTASSMDGVTQALSQLIQQMDSVISQGSGEVYAADTVGTDAYAISLIPAPTAYAIGQVFNFKAGSSNVGPATLNVNGLGAITIRKNNDQALENNDIETGQIVTVAYDGTYFQMQSQVANLFASIASLQNASAIYAADSVGTDAYAVTLSPAPTGYTNGMTIYVKVGTANTGPATINVNGLGAKSIVKSFNAALQTGDVLAGQIIQLSYDGTNFQMMSPSAAAGLRVKALYATRDISITGVQTISGVGFQPKLVLIEAVLDSVAGQANGGNPIRSSGNYDGTTQGCTYDGNDTGNPVTGMAFGTSSEIIQLNRNGVSSSVGANAVASNLGADGFDLTWAKAGFPTGTCKMIISCFG